MVKEREGERGRERERERMWISMATCFSCEQLRLLCLCFLASKMEVTIVLSLEG
jgi:hypothetical protein